MRIEDLLSIAHTYGSPVYVYDAGRMSSRYQRLTVAFNSMPHLHINYAMKTLSNISVLKPMKKLGTGLDTVSIQEVQLGLHAGFAPQQITFTPNGVSMDEIGEAMRLGIQLNIDNLSILEQFGSRHPEVPVCIRINPHVMAGGNSSISVKHIDSKFSISIHQVPRILRIVEDTKMHINGMHIHTDSGILDINTFLYTTGVLFGMAKNFRNLQFIDFGSGFKVPYEEGGIQTDIEKSNERLGVRFLAFCQEYGRDLTLAFEPGKFLVSQAGYFLVRINVVKQTTSTVSAEVDPGFSHLIQPMFYGVTHFIENISNPEKHKRFYSVVDYVCETNTFTSNQQMAGITEGDIFCSHNAGAYCYTTLSNCNPRLRPAEVLWHKGETHLIRRTETLDDLVGGQIEIEI